MTAFSASVALVTNPAQAANLTYNWSFNGLANTGGTFVADDVTGLLSSISGTLGGATITGLLPVSGYAGNDNLVPLTGNGISFSTSSDNWNMYNWNGAAIIVGDGYYQGQFQYSQATTAVPEPLTILGAATAAGLGANFKRKFAKNQKEKAQKDA